MFKVAKRHNLEVLEEYGFKNKGNIYFLEDKINNCQYWVYKDKRDFYMFNFNKCRNVNLSLIGKLINKGIIEEE